MKKHKVESSTDSSTTINCGTTSDIQSDNKTSTADQQDGSNDVDDVDEDDCEKDEDNEDDDLQNDVSILTAVANKMINDHIDDDLSFLSDIGQNYRARSNSLPVLSSSVNPKFSAVTMMRPRCKNYVVLQIIIQE